MKRLWGLVFGIVGLAVSTPAWADRDTARYTSVTVFGDSLVDAGNYYYATGGNNPLPGFPYPDVSQGYYPYRLTNGLDYPDLLSQSLFGAPTSAFLTPVTGGTNFAFAGSSLAGGGPAVPGFATQLGYWQAVVPAADPNGIYVLTFGANDLFSVGGVFGSPPADPSAYLMAAAQAYASGVQALNDAGARNIVMTNFPFVNPLLAPYTGLANSYLNTALAGLNLDSDTDLMVFKLSELSLNILTTPEAYGLPPLNTTESCIQVGAQGTNCEGYFSFDGVHPTAAIQAVVYSEMNRQFALDATVPEPATWALMLLGFAMVGGAMRRRRSPARAAIDFAFATV